MQALKIAVIGPRGSGKTYISDHVSGQPAADIPPSYDPTVGVRILPFIHESADLPPTEVELWDCSGDQAYEACWPAILKDLAGAIVVFDASSAAQTDEAKLWCEWFGSKAGLGSGQLALFGVTEDLNASLKSFSFNNDRVFVPAIPVSLKSGGEFPAESSASAAFTNFLRSVARTLSGSAPAVGQ